jgi:LmbE family N-acetylglucosaminyl deacetylase
MRNMIKKLLFKQALKRRISGWRALYQSESCCDQPAITREPGGGRIVVLAPHMDDEVLGCGGTVARHVRAGADVTVVFLTDGRHGGRSNPALSESERERSLRELIETRRREARQAGDVLGVQAMIFLDAEDQQLRASTRVTTRLREALESLQPDLVYLPFFLERHADHRAANDVMLAATAGSVLDFECRGYEVWTPLLANCLVSIDDVVDLKKRAIACYRSQIIEMDYPHFAIGLNAYRASTLRNGGRFAEAFHALPLTDYRRFHRAVCLP